MAVPGRCNGMISDDEEDGALFGGEIEILEADSDSDTPPHLRELAAASRLGNMDLLRATLDQDSTLRNGTISNNEEDDALFGGEIEILEAYTDSDSDSDSDTGSGTDSDSGSASSSASDSGTGSDTGTDIDTPPHLRELAAAARLGNMDLLRAALDNLNGNIDVPVEDGDTALHLTCLYGHLHCVQLLLERGASLEVKDEDDAIPLHDACAGGFTDIVQLLLTSANGPEFVKRMLETLDVEGDTPLHHAARGEHADVIRLLLASGASPTRTNIYGKIPSELADPDTQARRILDEAAGSLDRG